MTAASAPDPDTGDPPVAGARVAAAESIAVRRLWHDDRYEARRRG